MSYHYTDLDEKPMIVSDDKAIIAQLRKEVEQLQYLNTKLQQDLDYAEAQIDQLVWELNVATS